MWSHTENSVLRLRPLRGPFGKVLCKKAVKQSKITSSVFKSSSCQWIWNLGKMPEGLCGGTELVTQLRDKKKPYKGRKQGSGIWEKHWSIFWALGNEVRKIKAQGKSTGLGMSILKKAFYLYIGERREIEENAGPLFNKMEYLVRIEKRLVHQMSDHLPDISGFRGHDKGWTNENLVKRVKSGYALEDWTYTSPWAPMGWSHLCWWSSHRPLEGHYG